MRARVLALLVAALACGVVARPAVAEETTAAGTPASYVLQLDLHPGLPTLWKSLRKVNDRGDDEGSWLELSYEEQLLAPESQVPAPTAKPGEEPADARTGPRARVATRVLRARWSSRVGDERLLLDTATTPAGGVPPPAAGEWAILAGTVGSYLVAQVDAHGHVDHLTGLEELRARVHEHLPAENAELTWLQVSARLRKDTLLAKMDEHLSWLPSGEVAIGESWSRHTSQTLLGGTLDIDRDLTYTLLAARTVADSIWLEIQITGELAGASQLPELSYEGGTCKGTIQFDATHGRLVELHLTTTTEIRLEGKKEVTIISEHLTPARPEDLPPAQSKPR